LTTSIEGLSIKHIIVINMNKLLMVGAEQIELGTAGLDGYLDKRTSIFKLEFINSKVFKFL